jgi:hypothetical protein
MTLTDAPSVANILAVYNAATAEDIREGLAWYQTAHNWCRVMAKGRPHLIRRNAGIVAALSPMNAWGNNKRKAVEVISKRGRITVVKGQPNGIGLGTNVVKAIAIYNGADPAEVLKGDKVLAFYRTSLDPQGDIDPVIDRHAFDIAVGERTDEKRRGALSRKGVYEAFANAYREAAKVAGIGSAQMQAITWIAWRNLHGIDAD